jgi:hypothetical protein
MNNMSAARGPCQSFPEQAEALERLVTYLLSA